MAMPPPFADMSRRLAETYKAQVVDQIRRPSVLAGLLPPRPTRWQRLRRWVMAAIGRPLTEAPRPTVRWDSDASPEGES